MGGGTDTHQIIIDVTSKGLSGARAERILESTGIITNRNYIPGDTEKKASGLRLGTGPISVRGVDRNHVVQIADIIDNALMNPGNQEVSDRLRKDVFEICRQFPVYNSSVPE